MPSNSEPRPMKRVGLSELRKMNAAYLRNLKEPLEICNGCQPVRVLIPYRQYLELQDAYRKLAVEISDVR